jgi:hypothetical protein
VGATTGDFRGRVRDRLAAEGERVSVPVRGNAGWPVGERVGRWVARHHRRARGHGGCRIRGRGLPVRAPGLNPVAPEWVHGTRAVVEPDRTPTADGLQQRARDSFGRPREPPLPKPQN